MYAGIENALLGTTLTLTSSMRLSRKPRTTETVRFDIVNNDWSEVPQYLDDPYRRTSISKIRPLPAEIDNLWKKPDYPYISRIVEGRRCWATRRDACASIKGKRGADCALAHRSALIANLEPRVDAEELRKGLPTVTRADETPHLDCAICLGHSYMSEDSSRTCETHQYALRRGIQQRTWSTKLIPTNASMQ
jgi:hypothetical protein